MLNLIAAVYLFIGLALAFRIVGVCCDAGDSWKQILAHVLWTLLAWPIAFIPESWMRR
jgi:hypothetical protein